MFEVTGRTVSLPPALADLLADLEGAAIVELLSPDQGHVRFVGDAHPLPFLHGHEASEDVAGLAVVASGRVTAGLARAGSEVRVLHLLWRDGSNHTALSGLEGPEFVALSPAEGLVPDAMRRSLDLPTPPPTDPPIGYWFGVWLAALPDEASTIDHALAWHPGIDPRELEAGFDSSEHAIAFAVERLLEHARATGWEGVRQSAADGWFELGRCEPELAAWFDEGSFARWITASIPDPSLQLDERSRSLPLDLILLFTAVAVGCGVDW